MTENIFKLTSARREEDADEKDEGGVDVGGDVTHLWRAAEVVVGLDGRVGDGVARVVILGRHVVEEA